MRQEVPDILKALKNLDLKLVLISNSSFPDEKSLARLKILRYFDKTVCSPAFGMSNYLFLSQALISLPGAIVSARSVFVSEQLDGNLKLAGRAGMWLVWINRKNKKRELSFGWKVKNINEVLSVIVRNKDKIDISSFLK